MPRKKTTNHLRSNKTIIKNPNHGYNLRSLKKKDKDEKLINQLLNDVNNNVEIQTQSNHKKDDTIIVPDDTTSKIDGFFRMPKSFLFIDKEQFDKSPKFNEEKYASFKELFTAETKLDWIDNKFYKEFYHDLIETYITDDEQFAFLNYLVDNELELNYEENAIIRMYATENGAYKSQTFNFSNKLRLKFVSMLIEIFRCLHWTQILPIESTILVMNTFQYISFLIKEAKKYAKYNLPQNE